MTRLTDNDKTFGPLTIGKTDWKAYRLIYSAGNNEDYPREKGNKITFYFNGFVARLSLPEIIKPYRLTVKAKYWDEETIKRMGRDWYYEYFDKEYGISYSSNFLQLYYGTQSDGSYHDGVPEKRMSWFLPWGEYRYVEERYYGVNEEVIYEAKDKYELKLNHNIKETIPTVDYLIEDYDGKQIVAKTIVQYRRWQKGRKPFQWLAWFRKDTVTKSVEITFTEEVGTDKGSWKGGLIGTSIEMLPNESRINAFKRYCDQLHRAKHGKYRIKFLGKVV